MGLSVDIDRILKDNTRKQGTRKCGFLVNQGGKLTPKEKQVLIAKNRERYGLSEEEVAAIRLPSASYLVEIYSVSKITNSKSRMSTVEKINHLIKLELALLNKLDMIKHKRIGGGGSTGQQRFGFTPINQMNEGEEKAEDDSDVEEEAEHVSSLSKPLKETCTASNTATTQECNTEDLAEEESLSRARNMAKRRIID